MKGMLIGMSLDKGVMDLALRYFITCEAIALQTRQIVDKMNDQGHKITAIFMSGGLVKNAVLMQLIGKFKYHGSTDYVRPKLSLIMHSLFKSMAITIQRTYVMSQFNCQLHIRLQLSWVRPCWERPLMYPLNYRNPKRFPSRKSLRRERIK
jgi:hypothetical protein